MNSCWHLINVLIWFVTSVFLCGFKVHLFKVYFLVTKTVPCNRIYPNSSCLSHLITLNRPRPSLVQWQSYCLWNHASPVVLVLNTNIDPVVLVLVLNTDIDPVVLVLNTDTDPEDTSIRPKHRHLTTIPQTVFPHRSAADVLHLYKWRSESEQQLTCYSESPALIRMKILLLMVSARINATHFGCVCSKNGPVSVRKHGGACMQMSCCLLLIIM